MSSSPEPKITYADLFNSSIGDSLTLQMLIAVSLSLFDSKVTDNLVITSF